MANFDLDLFVIGGGSGGVRAARTAAGHGARVALAEAYRVGGIHILGRDAAELIQLAAVAVRLGVTKHQLDSTLAVHPTTTEELATMCAPSR